MAKYGFNLLWSQEDQGFIATCPDFPGLSAFGETPEGALTEAKIALDLFIESLTSSGEPLPKPTECAEYSGQIRLRMPKTLHASLAHKADKEGVSLNTWIITLLAERNAVSKLADEVRSRIENVEKAIHVQKAVPMTIVITQRQEAFYTPKAMRGEKHDKIKPSLN